MSFLVIDVVPVIKIRIKTWVTLIILAFILSQVSIAYAYVGLGGYSSEKVIQDGSGGSLVLSQDGSGPVVVGQGLRVLTLPGSSYMDSSGTHATFVGRIVSMNGFSSGVTWFEWGYTPSYGNTLASIPVSGTGDYSINIDGFDPDKEIYYRFNSNTDGTVYGNNQVIGEVVGVGVPTVYRLAEVLPYIWIGIVILMIWGMIAAEVPIIVALMIGGILILVGIAGGEAVLGALRNMW
jgi:hypothetical protein